MFVMTELSKPQSILRGQYGIANLYKHIKPLFTNHANQAVFFVKQALINRTNHAYPDTLKFRSMIRLYNLGFALVFGLIVVKLAIHI